LKKQDEKNHTKQKTVTKLESIERCEDHPELYNLTINKFAKKGEMNTKTALKDEVDEFIYSIKHIPYILPSP
jgi:hypothetical protein